MTKEQSQLVEENINLVYWVVTHHFPGCLGDEDIIQSGMMGLCHAAINFNGSCKFSSFAVPCIKHAILNEFARRRKHLSTLSLDYIQNEDEDDREFGGCIVGEDDTEILYSSNFNIFREQLTDHELQVLELLEDGLTGRDAAKKLGISPQRVNQIKRRIYHKWRKYNGNY